MINYSDMEFCFIVRGVIGCKNCEYLKTGTTVDETQCIATGKQKRELLEALRLELKLAEKSW